jgi:ATPase subunit of ABC transporter with duplicated ATPase domains
MVPLAPQRLQEAAALLARAEASASTEPMRYATSLAEWGDAGGYEAEVFWDACCTKAIGEPFADLERRALRTFSGGEQKRLALEALLRSDYDVLLLDEPDNFLDVPGKRWLEGELRASRKTMLFVSHDRELLAASATKIVTVEASGAWTHGSGFADYHEARQARLENREHALAVFEDERKRLEELVIEMRRRAKISDTFAPRLKAAESRLRQFLERTEAPELVREQRIDMRLGGARTGKRALAVRQLELDGLTDPFDLELWYSERVAVLGGNGAGKSHFLRVLGGDDSVAHSGDVRLGAGVVPGLFNQTHEHPDWSGQTLLQILHRNDVVRGPAMGMLRRYEMQGCADQTFDTLSGGQQARFQILLLELSGATLLLLDEPTDNLDLVSAEALEAGLAEFQGTVIAVTHDRWFLRSFDRFVVFNDDCTVTDHLDRPSDWR